MKRMVGGFFCALFLTFVLFGKVKAQESGKSIEDMDLYATSAVLMDADSGRVLYGKNADVPMAMASTTKIMTCILVLELGKIEDTLRVSAYAASMPKVKLYINKGETYQVKDLLYSLMLESHNDSAVALAEYVGKQYLSEELRDKPTSEYTVEESKAALAAFAELMNKKAEEIGCNDTYFITPNGLDATETITTAGGEVIQKEHHTTAEELAKIMSYCIKESPQKDMFLNITKTGCYSFAANNRSFSCNNHNAFLSMMDGVLSGKTGFTNKAGYCYVGALERDGRTFVVALLACGWPNHKTWKWNDTRELMEYGVTNYFYRSFREEGTAFDESILQPIRVLEGQQEILGEKVYVGVEVAERNAMEGKSEPETSETKKTAEDSAEVQLEGMLLRTDESVQVKYKQESLLEAPVEVGTLVGNIYYLVDGIVCRTEDIITTEAVAQIDFKWCVLQVWERFLLEG